MSSRKDINRSRLDKLTSRLRARTDSEGNPQRGYARNVAAIRAEIDVLSEQMEAHDGE